MKLLVLLIVLFRETLGLIYPKKSSPFTLKMNQRTTLNKIKQHYASLTPHSSPHANKTSPKEGSIDSNSQKNAFKNIEKYPPPPPMHMRNISEGSIYVAFIDHYYCYVGRTDNPALSIDSNGHEFTERDKKHIQYLDPLTSYDGDLESWERKETLLRMLMGGYENVRGWMFGKEQLTMLDRNLIAREMGQRLKVCIKCGSEDHYDFQCKPLTGANNSKVQPWDAIKNAKLRRTIKWITSSKNDNDTLSTADPGTNPTNIESTIFGIQSSNTLKNISCIVHDDIVHPEDKQEENAEKGLVWPIMSGVPITAPSKHSEFNSPLSESHTVVVANNQSRLQRFKSNAFISYFTKLLVFAGQTLLFLAVSSYRRVATIEIN